MTKYIGVIIAWILVAGVVLYIVQHSADLVRGFTYLTKGGSIKGLFHYIDTVYK